MNNILSIISVIWAAVILADLTFLIQRWYIKEYRLDRMYIYLKQNWLRIYFPQMRRMRISPKTITILALNLLAFSGIWYVLNTILIIKVFIINLVLFPITFFSVELVGFPTKIIHGLKIRQAKKKLAKFPQLIVIGVTGSYGKTSTKDFITAVLREKYHVASTEKSKNSTIGVAEAILELVTSKHDVFVVEMGAYKRGEIKEICDVVKPSIGVITGINEQHIELFGTLENTRKAKYELIESLPSNGTAIFNSDNEYSRLMAKQTRNKKVITYGTGKDAMVKLSNIAQSKTRLTLKVAFGKEQLSLEVPLIGAHFALNLGAAISVAWVLGLKSSQIKNGLSKIDPVMSRMKIARQYHGASIVDNSFNANPDSIKAAIEYMKLYSGKKYLVLMPLIELGKHAERLHEELGKIIGQTVDTVLLTNRSYKKDLERGISKSSKMTRIEVASTKKIAKLLSTNLENNDVAVLVGKESAPVLKYLTK